MKHLKKFNEQINVNEKSIDVVKKYSLEYPEFSDYFNNFLNRYPDFYDFYEASIPNELEDENEIDDYITKMEDKELEIARQVDGNYPGDDIWYQFFFDLRESEWYDE